jgi:hypothetical protein
MALMNKSHKENLYPALLITRNYRMVCNIRGVHELPGQCLQEDNYPERLASTEGMV